MKQVNKTELVRQKMSGRTKVPGHHIAGDQSKTVLRRRAKRNKVCNFQTNEMKTVMEKNKHISNNFLNREKRESGNKRKKKEKAGQTV